MRARRLVVLALCASAAAGFVYASVGQLNGWIFGYAFHDEPAPTLTADTVAVVCLWVLALLALVLAVVVYGAMVLVLADDIGARDAMRASSRRAAKDWWRAIPAMAVGVVLVALVIPCVVAAPIIGWATPRITGRRAPRDHVAGTVPQHAAVALAAGVVAAAVWAGLLIVAEVSGDGPASLPWLMAFCVATVLGLAGTLAAASVAAGAVAVLDHAMRPSPWPAPMPTWVLAARPPSAAPLPGPAVHTDPAASPPR